MTDGDDDDSVDTDPVVGRNDYDPSDVATDIEVQTSERLRGDDIASWEKASAPFLAMIATRPQTMGALKNLAMRQHTSVKLAEECVFWLENQGKVESFRNFSGLKHYRLPRAMVETVEEPPKPRIPDVTKQEETMAVNQMTTAQAAALLEMNPAALLAAVKRGAVKAQSSGRGVPVMFDRAAVMAYRGERSKAAREPQERPKRELREKAKAPLPAAPAPVAAVYSIEDRVRALAMLVDDGDITAEDAWNKLRARVVA